MQAPNAALIEGSSKDFCLIGGRHRGRILSAGDVIDAEDTKPSSVDCASRSNYFFPPSGRWI
jgi:hypothetical protein